MKTEPIVPASLEFNEQGLPFSTTFDDVYQPHADVLAQARHVFLAGNNLPRRWQGRDRFVVLETGFGLGNNFLATWDAWRHDPDRCEQLTFVSIELHPFTHEALQAVHRSSPVADLAAQLADAWPPLTPNLHRLSFEDGRVQLLLAFGDVSQWLRELVLTADAFFLDGFAPAKNPQMWETRVMKALGRLAAPDATAATWTAARSVRDGLATAGFTVHRNEGTGGKRHITLAHYAPAFTPRRAPSRNGVAPGHDRHALIVGAGLAGCAAAWALAEQGWRSTVFDRQAAPAQETSGNPGGLFHGIVNAQDGLHARFNRAAALEAEHAVRYAIARHGVEGQVQGLLRLETTLADVHAMRDLLTRIGLPADYVQALSAEQATQICGLPVQQPAWFYPGGGWVHPAGLSRSFLQRAAAKARFQGNTEVHSLQRVDTGWQLRDAQGQLIAEAPVVVLANAGDAMRLLGQPDWPVSRVRGQLSMLPASAISNAGLPHIPVAGAGYLLPPVAGLNVFGATSQASDDEPALRDSDHAHNLAQLTRLMGESLSVLPEQLQGRVGWRWVTDDRLPLIGGVPDPASNATGRVLDHARFVPRVPGLFVFSALGSRGITWAALGAQVLASHISGAPSPLEASLLDAVDPARFIARAIRRAAG